MVRDLSPELAAMLLATVIGGYTLIGGLGATFYVSYFNTALIFVLILMLVVEVFYNPTGNPENPFGSSEKVYEYITCWKAPEGEMGNKGGSYLTFFSSGDFLHIKSYVPFPCIKIFAILKIKYSMFWEHFRWFGFWHRQHCWQLWYRVLRSSLLAVFCSGQTTSGNDFNLPCFINYEKLFFCNF